MRNDYVEFTCGKRREDEPTLVMNEREPIPMVEPPLLTDVVLADPNDPSTWEVR